MTPDDLEFRRGYYGDPVARRALDALVLDVFGGPDFGPWNALGYDFAEYTPFSWFDRGRVVANVSASPMHLVVDGIETTAVQMGTVASRPEARGRGRVRALVEKAHAFWAPCEPLWFLFANESAAGFYERLGYRRVEEADFVAPAPPWIPAGAGARRLDLAERRDRDLLRRLAERRAPVSRRLGAHRESWLTMFHAAVRHPRSLIRIEPLDVVAIAGIAGRTLRLVDVIGERVPPLRDLYPFVGGPEVEEVAFGFTPDRMGVDGVTARPRDSLLLVRGTLDVAAPFRFPETAEA